MYLVLTGNEYGFDLNDNIHLNLLEEEDANIKFQEYLIEYGAAGMWKIENNKLNCIKTEINL